MSHQRNTTPLRGAVEERNLGVVLLQGIGVEHCCSPCIWVHAFAVSRLVNDLGHAIAINAYFITMNDLEPRLIGLAKESVLVSVELYKAYLYSP